MSDRTTFGQFLSFYRCCLVALIFTSLLGLVPPVMADDASPVTAVPAKASLAADASILRPGDTVLLSLPGEASLNTTVQIQRNGKILLPEIGEVYVAGLTLAEGAEKVRLLLQEVILDLTAFELILKQRRLIISVLGYVGKPGTVDLPDNATIQEAISAAQGLITGAQLDKLQVRRGDQVHTFNYKYYLDSGDSSKLPKLQPLDTLFIPSSPLMGNVQVDFDAASLISGGDTGDTREAVTIFGEVANAGTFSYQEGASIVDLLMRAGGVTRFAGVKKIRVLSSGDPVMFDLKKYLDTGDKKLLVSVSPGDTIYVPMQVEEISSNAAAVHVMGEVIKPGQYNWSADMSLFDLVTQAGGPNNNGNLARLKILSRDDQGNLNSRFFDMAKFMEQGGALSDIPLLKAQDTVIVPPLADEGGEKSDWLRQSPKDSIYLMGEVASPGRYRFDNNMHFLDILTAAGGPNDAADVHNIRITHRSGGASSGKAPVVTQLDLGLYFQQGDESLLPKVSTGDVIYIPAKDSLWLSAPKEQTIRVLGAVSNQGRYRYNQSMTILDLLAQAGGLSPSAQLSSIIVVSAADDQSNNQLADDKQQAKVTRFDLLEFSSSGDFNQLPVLKIGDTVYVLHKEDSTWNRFFIGLQETLSTYSILRILGGA